MGKLIMALGEPGTGKSRAILNLDPEKTVVIKPNQKDFPFKGANKKYNTEKKNVFITNSFPQVKALLESINNGGKITTVIIEDLTHYFSARVMKDAKLQGFQKWTDLALDVFNALVAIEPTLRQDLYVIIIAHTSASTDVQGNQVITLQTPGKLLENAIKLPSYFTYVLHTDVSAGAAGVEYNFLTNNDGSGRIAKSPEGCLNKLEPNDYKLIIEKIEAYQNGED